MMNESHTPKSDLMKLLDARDWPAIAAIAPDQFKKDWPRLLDDYVAGERDNFDDLMTIGAVCGGYDVLACDQLTVTWLQSQDHPRALEAACNVLAGCWQPQLQQAPINSLILQHLVDHSERLVLDRYAQAALTSLLQQLVELPSFKDLPDGLRSRIAKIVQPEDE